MEKKVKVAKNVSVPRGKLEKIKKKPGSSNVGKYKEVSKKSFAGPSGGAAQGSFPIDTLKRAKNALARAHFAPNPSGIRAAVKKKWGNKIKSLKGKK